MRLYKDQDEAALHRRAIESLAEHEHAEVDEVAAVYEAELAQIKAVARIDDFVPAFAHRRTLMALRRRDRRRA
jgi:hypothetical protein